MRSDPKLIACVDADYRDHEAITAVVTIRDWTDEATVGEHVLRSPHTPAPYVPGSFFLREMPGTLAALGELGGTVGLLVIDGYVWLGADRPGLGARLHDALALPIVGVAKTRFHDNDRAVELVRGSGTRPLYITSVGLDAHDAAAHVARMHGIYRVPTILKRVDRLAREA